MNAGILLSTPGAASKVNGQPVQNPYPGSTIRAYRVKGAKITGILLQTIVTNPSATFTFCEIQESGFKEPTAGGTLIFLIAYFGVFHSYPPF